MYLKVNSISDIITNSSSEIFLIQDEKFENDSSYSGIEEVIAFETIDDVMFVVDSELQYYFENADYPYNTVLGLIRCIQSDKLEELYDFKQDCINTLCNILLGKVFVKVSNDEPDTLDSIRNTYAGRYVEWQY